jgi:hypothetical protein
MNSSEPLDTKVRQHVSSEAISWESEFVDRLELFFARQATNLPQSVTIADYRQFMTSAFVQALASSGASSEEISDLLGGILENLSKTLELKPKDLDSLTDLTGHPEQRPSHEMSIEEFDRRTEEWIKLHPVLDHAIDDSRESFYAGRGE